MSQPYIESKTTVFSGRQKLTSAVKLRPESDGRLQIALYR